MDCQKQPYLYTISALAHIFCFKRASISPLSSCLFGWCLELWLSTKYDLCRISDSACNNNIVQPFWEHLNFGISEEESALEKWHLYIFGSSAHGKKE